MEGRCRPLQPASGVTVGVFWLQSSLTSEMRNLTFAHIKDSHHRHFPEARHDFMAIHPEDFLSLVTSDMAGEAFDQAVAREYMRNHQQPAQYEPNSSPDFEAEHNNRRLSQHEKRQQRRQAMPKHMYINDQFRSSKDSGQFCLCGCTCSCSDSRHNQ